MIQNYINITKLYLAIRLNLSAIKWLYSVLCDVDVFELKPALEKKKTTEIKYLVLDGDLYLNCVFFTVLRYIYCHTILYKETEITNKQTSPHLVYAFRLKHWVLKAKLTSSICKTKVKTAESLTQRQSYHLFIFIGA